MLDGRPRGAIEHRVGREREAPVCRNYWRQTWYMLM